MIRFVGCALAALTLAGTAGARSTGPPPGTASVGTRTVTLSYGGSCWGTQCIDKIPPANRTDLVRMRVRTGAAVTIRLRFSATSWSVGLLGGRRKTLAPGRVAVWRASGSGILDVEARAPGGSAQYLARVSIVP